ncbi:hypothetical protein KR067_001844 [Drosophila pandora]|nr:hypothetical protein KR067_001844 [Drosophila pandora]
MLVATIGMVLILQANLIASQVKVLVVQDSNPLVLSNGNFIRQPSGYFPWQRNVFKLKNFTAIESNESIQTINWTGNSSLSLSTNQNFFGNFMRNIFRLPLWQPNPPYTTIIGRAFSDSIQEPSYYGQYSPVVAPALMPKANRKVVRRKVPRRVLVRNLKSNQALLTNFKTVKVPMYEDDWQVRTRVLS